MVDPIVDAVEYCNSIATSSSGDGTIKSEFYSTLASYCQQKLWHQLTTSVLEYVADNTNGDDFTLLYHNVILKFYSKLHPLSTSRIATAVANYQLSSVSSSIDSVETGADDAKAILENLITLFNEELQKSKAAESDPYRKKKGDNTMNWNNAILFLQSKRNLLTLYFVQLSGSTITADYKNNPEMVAIVSDMKKNTVIVQELSSIAQKSSPSTAKASKKEVSDAMTDISIVLSAHYEQCMTYYKLIGPPEAFYEQAMQFVTYSPPPPPTSSGDGTEGEKLPMGTIDYYQLAIDLCLSALTGDGVYTLGEVEQTPCIRLLQQGTGEYKWLVDLLQAVSLGKVLEFQNLTQQYAAQIQQQPALTSRASVVEEKLTLMSLVEYIVSAESTRSGGGTATTTSGMDIDVPVDDSLTTRNRRGGGTTVTLSEVATALHRPIDQVEYVIMRACSVGLIKATIDQVDGIALITWIMPRVLNANQMVNLANQFTTWNTHLQKMESFMKDHTQALFA